MNIEINETNGCGSILKDLGRFERLQDWLLAIKNKEVAFYPMDCAVKIGQKSFPVVNGGFITKDIDVAINEAKKLPPVFRNLPNDYMNIVADSFEGELFFNTNYSAD